MGLLGREPSAHVWPDESARCPAGPVSPHHLCRVHGMTQHIACVQWLVTVGWSSDARQVLPFQSDRTADSQVRHVLYLILRARLLHPGAAVYPGAVECRECLGGVWSVQQVRTLWL